MTTLDSSLKALVLPFLLAAGCTAFAQGNDPWYGGQRAGFWGMNDSVGVRGALPGAFNPPGTNAESLNALRQFGGYRLSNAFAIEGSQTQFSSSSSGCNGDPGAGGDSHACYGAAWSLSGVATLPFQSGLALYGRLGLHYWQKGSPEEANGHHNVDEPGGFGKVYGLGLSYGLTKSITVHAESERYSDLPGNNLSGTSTGFGLDSSVHSIGLSIKF
ncbi:MAG: outer membrane beta-barrel protein [Betaproteobacteria bacterium]|jgi:opacity protein-like surface antigen